jgi:hypothetical protein
MPLISSSSSSSSASEKFSEPPRFDGEGKRKGWRRARRWSTGY